MNKYKLEKYLFKLRTTSPESNSRQIYLQKINQYGGTMKKEQFTQLFHAANDSFKKIKHRHGALKDLFKLDKSDAYPITEEMIAKHLKEFNEKSYEYNTYINSILHQLDSKQITDPNLSKALIYIIKNIFDRETKVTGTSADGIEANVHILFDNFNTSTQKQEQEQRDIKATQKAAWYDGSQKKHIIFTKPNGDINITPNLEVPKDESIGFAIQYATHSTPLRTDPVPDDFGKIDEKQAHMYGN